jgi:4-hydroxy-tetrahydrodipicolinate synthase
VQTPFRDDDTIDLVCLKKEIDFIVEAGGHGLCWPQAGSEFELLTDDERFQTAEFIVKSAQGRVPVIIGVQSTNYWKTALAFARHAERIGADGIISLPPFQAGPSLEDVAEYYKTLARTVSLPIFIQSASNRFGPAMPVDMIIALARECPTVSYIKDEADPSFERITELCQKGTGVMQGVFSGSGANNLINEMSVGSHGSCPGADLVDVFARVFDLYQAGDTAKAEALFDRLLPMRRLKTKAHWMLLMKERLRRRGVFETTRSRIAPYELVWSDPQEKAAFDVAYDAIQPLFTV